MTRTKKKTARNAITPAQAQLNHLQGRICDVIELCDELAGRHGGLIEVVQLGMDHAVDDNDGTLIGIDASIRLLQKSTVMMGGQLRLIARSMGTN